VRSPNRQYIPQPSPTECAYYAGYVDAEGCITVSSANHDTTWVAQVTFGQTQPDVLLKLHNAYPGSRLYYIKARNGWRPQIHFMLSRYNAVACFLTDIEPYLGEKRDQVRAVLDRFASRMPHDAGKALVADLTRMKAQEIKLSSLPNDALTEHQKMRRCRIDGCPRRARAQGLCPRHYQTARKRGEVSAIERTFAYLHEPSDIDKAYASGFFDGDGHIDFHRLNAANAWYAAICFNQTRVDGVLRLRYIYGGSLKPKLSKPPRRLQLRWYLAYHEAVRRFLEDIQPYVIEKREEVQLVLDRYHLGMTDEEGWTLHSKLQRLRDRRLPPGFAQHIKALRQAAKRA
jgi:hypothetical protein